MHAINLNKTTFFRGIINFFGTSNTDKQLLIDLQRFSNEYKLKNYTYITMMFIFDSGINLIELENYGGNDFDVDLALAFN